MRRHDFDVGFAPTGPDGPALRVVLNPRFTPGELIDDFPRNLITGYGRVVLGGLELAPAAGNAIAVRFGTRLSDADRAVLLNLLDFGQDHVAARSTTIEAVEFLVPEPEGRSANGLMQALAEANAAAIARMSALMADYAVIEEADHDRADWPEAQFWRYIYTVILEFAPGLDPQHEAALADGMEVLHTAAMWSGFNTDMTQVEAIREGLSGVAYEIAGGDTEFQYIVERPGSNPALPVTLLLDRFGAATGRSPVAMQINVSEEP